MKKWLIVILAVLVGISFWWAWPKSETLEFTPYMVGHYRGFGLVPDDTFLLGMSFYRVTFTPPNEGRWEVEYVRPGYNHCKGFYDDGTLHEESKCLVELLGPYNHPCPDIHNVQFGRYYKPDGTLGSEVKNGTGVQTYWTLDGTKIWELELHDFKRVRHSRWHSNGQLLQTQAYVDGKVHGPFVTYYSSGAKKTEGADFQGDRSGKWIRYNEDGTVKKVEDYTALSDELSTQSQPSAGSD